MGVMAQEERGVEGGEDSASSSREETLRERNLCLGVEVAVELRSDSGSLMVHTVDSDSFRKRKVGFSREWEDL